MRIRSWWLTFRNTVMEAGAHSLRKLVRRTLLILSVPALGCDVLVVVCSGQFTLESTGFLKKKG